MLLNSTNCSIFCAPWLLVIALTADIAVAVPPVAAENSLTRTIADFELPDYRGRVHKLSECDQPVVVVAFLGTECPLAKLYSRRLVELQAEFGSSQVLFLGIDANQQDSLLEISAHARRYEIGFPLLKDMGNKVADLFGATRTPEVFVLDQKRVVRYQGRIDDQYGIGYVKTEPGSFELRQAIEQLLAGEPVQTPYAPSVGCRIGRVREPQQDADVTYSNQIVRILNQRCVECHRAGEIAPFALTNYEEVVGWAEMIEEVVREQRMPPWHADPAVGHFANDRSMTDEEKQLIYDWVDAGAPLGDLANMPIAPSWTTGWQLPREPDFVAPIVDKPFRVPPEGEVRYQYFSIDPGFDEDKWVDAVEIRPGNRAVVHHVLMFSGSRQEVGERFQGGASGYDGIYVPGQRIDAYPAGTARRIKAGSQLFFQVHYTPIGTEQFDQTTLGMTFVDADSVQFEVQTASAVNTALKIPADDANYRVDATTPPLASPVTLLSFNPHMHLRGKSFAYEALLPDGQQLPLLDVPHYDFNWQTAYRLAEPLELPAGTRIHCTATFDNSAENLNNPNPSETVKWGEQTWDEMMIGYFDYTRPVAESGKPIMDMAQARAAQLMKRLDSNGDGKLQRTELSLKYNLIFGTFDTNKDGFVDVDELKQSLQDR